MTKTKAKTGNVNGFRLGHWNLELGIYLEFGICDLEFYFYCLPHTVDREPNSFST
jgi:hypothetical protein